MKYSAIFKQTLLIITIIIAQPIKLTVGCGWDSEYPYNYSFLNQSAFLENSPYSNFYFSSDEPFWDDENIDDENLKDWKKYFGDKYSDEQINWLVYNSTLSDILAININGLNDAPIYRLYDEDLGNYIYYARQCESVATIIYTESWYYRNRNNEEVDKQKADMLKLYDEGKKLYHKTKSKFLKLRYGFQLVRLQHYLKNYTDAIIDFDKYVEPLNDGSYIYYRALEQKAGAYGGLERNAEACYNFSLVFDHLKDRKLICLRSFQFSDDTEWDSCMGLAKSSEEKATLYFMRALEPESNRLEEMKYIYSIHPSSDKLQLLIVRELAKQEHNVLEWNKTYPYSILDNNILQEDNSLGYYAFITDVIKENKVSDIAFWQIAQAYICFLHGDITRSKTIIDALKKQPLSKEYLNQIAQIEYLNYLLAIKQVSTANEDYIPDAMSKIVPALNEYGENETYIQEYTYSHLYRVYAINNQYLKAMLCIGSHHRIGKSMNRALMEELLTLNRKANKTALEKHMLYTHPNTDSLSIERDMYFYMGCYYFRTNQLSKALDAYKHSSAIGEPDFIEPVTSAVFAGRIHDWYDVKPTHKADISYINLPKLAYVKNMVEVTEAMLWLEEQIKTNTKNSARYYFYLGNAYYNFTNSGFFSYTLTNTHDTYIHCIEETDTGDIADLFISYNEPYYGYSYDNYYYSSYTYCDCNPALAYFEKALQHSTNDEFTAKILFMMAKAEQCGETEQPYETRTAFNELKKYNNTAYYREIIKECKYFLQFVNKQD